TMWQVWTDRSEIDGLVERIMHTGQQPTNDEDLDLIGPIGRAANTTGSAGAALGLTEVGEALYARLDTCVKRTGTRHPRRWLAAGEGALAAATWWLGRRLDDTNDLDLTPSALSRTDRKSTRLNSSHVSISYAVFCLKRTRSKGGKPLCSL